LVSSEAKKKAIAEYKHKEELIEEAKLAYSASKNTTDGIFLLFLFFLLFSRKNNSLSGYSGK
jgi:hypothetical protein